MNFIYISYKIGLFWDFREPRRSTYNHVTQTANIRNRIYFRLNKIIPNPCPITGLRWVFFSSSLESHHRASTTFFFIFSLSSSFLPDFWKYDFFPLSIFLPENYINMSQVFKRGLSTLIPPKVASSAVSLALLVFCFLLVYVLLWERMVIGWRTTKRYFDRWKLAALLNGGTSFFSVIPSAFWSDWSC